MERSKVLIVDDNESLLATLFLFLEQSDFEVHTVSTVDEAIVQLGKSDFDVLLFDLAIGNRSGEEILYFLGVSLRRAPQTIIAMTAVTSLLEKSVLKENVSTILEKPFRFEDLLAAIKKNA